LAVVDGPRETCNRYDPAGGVPPSDTTTRVGVVGATITTGTATEFAIT
jgi:hypothetical protein